MQRLAVIRRQDQAGNTRDAAVNAAHVRYVYSTNSGSYIAFEDESGPNSNGVTPIGMASPDSVDDVIKRLNRPYWIDVLFRVGGLMLSAVAVILAIVLS